MEKVALIVEEVMERDDSQETGLAKVRVFSSLCKMLIMQGEEDQVSMSELRERAKLLA